MCVEEVPWPMQAAKKVWTNVVSKSTLILIPFCHYDLLSCLSYVVDGDLPLGGQQHGCASAARTGLSGKTSHLKLIPMQKSTAAKT